MRFYDAPEAVWKADGSPVTAADHAAEAVILPVIRALTPDIPVISEEEAAAGISPDIRGSRFWLVDPLDGTKEFLKRNGEFTVNIALIENGAPVLGVVHSPVTGDTYAAAGPGTATLTAGGVERSIAVRRPPAAGLTVVASRSHGGGPELDALLADLKVAELRSAGSSIKLCLVARGEGGFLSQARAHHGVGYRRRACRPARRRRRGLNRSMAGRFRYGKPDFRNPHFLGLR